VLFIYSIHVASRFTLSGFRFQSKYENRVNLLERYRQFIDGHPGFEMRAIGINLQFAQDAELFMHRVEVAAQSVRYKVLQYAKRQHDGIVPIVGFSWLHCTNSKKHYVRTLARYLYFAVRSGEKLGELSNACQGFSRAVAAKEPPSSQNRCTHVDSIFFQALVQPTSPDDYSIDNFAKLYYVAAPNGNTNRSADFIRHIAVHIIYSLRGAYILKCCSRWDSELDEQLSLKFLSEQHDNAFSAIQGTKRIAALCIEPVDGKVQWDENGEVNVLTVSGIVLVSGHAIKAMYHDLLIRSKTCMEELGFPILSSMLIEQCVDVSTRAPGEGIMTMNQHVFDAYCQEHPHLNKIQAVSQKGPKSVFQFCRRIFELSQTLIKALYLSGGPSSRLTEISCWMIANSESNCMRNIRYVRKAIAVINTYSKSQDACGTEVQANIACFADQVSYVSYIMII
jgi:hypothetical protein